MRTSLIETEQIEAHLLRLSEPGDALVFEARLLIEPDLQIKVDWQKAVYHLVKAYGRNQLKKEIETIHTKLFSQSEHRSFSQKIRQLFSKR